MLKNNLRRQKRNDDTQSNFNQRRKVRSVLSRPINRRSRYGSNKYSVSPGRNTISINDMSKQKAIETLETFNDIEACDFRSKSLSR